MAKSDPNLSSAEFAKRLIDSGLLSHDDIQSALPPQAGSMSILNANELAERLVAAGRLTSFQANAVLEQRLKDLFIGNYEVLERLGAGAMGVVYKARHRRMKRVVAIKVLSRAAANPAFVQRFQREVETLAQLIHPNVIMAFDAGETEAGPFLVMEFVAGRDLASIIEQNGPLSIAHAVEAVLQAARGLEYAHSKNIVHRDIKPANIMWDNSGVIKVADLGLARLSASHSKSETSLTQAGSIVGTVDYMAPEQALDSSSIDHRVDIYSLGCTLYFLLTAKALYDGNSVMAILLKHRDAPVPSLRGVRPDAPASLETLLTGMLAKQPDNRIGSMTEVIRNLTTIQTELSHAPVAAASGHATAAKHRTISELTVILVESSRTQAGIVRKYLQEAGITHIHHSGSGMQALELAKQHGGNVFLSSMHLSDMTGLQLATLVRSDHTFANTGFVLTTSGSDSDDVSALNVMPRTVLLQKPFDAKHLAVALSEATS